MNSYLSRQALLAIIGAAISAYLVFHYVEIHAGYSKEPSFCSLNGAFDCDRVAKSAFSSLFGIPVASYALMFYLGYILLLALGMPRKSDSEMVERKRERAAFRFFLTSLTVVVSVGLGLVSKFIIQTMCLMCAFLYIVNLILFLLAWKDNDLANIPKFRAWSLGFEETWRFFRPGAGGSIRRFPLLAVFAVVVLVILFLPRLILEKIVVPRAAEAMNREALEKYLAPWREAPETKLPPIGPSEVVFGNPDARHTIIEFSDFECPSCRMFAPFLAAALEEEKEHFRFVMFNFPIDKSCNRIIEADKHQNACNVAQVSACILEQSREVYWKFIEAAFQSEELQMESVQLLATSLGAKSPPLQDCLRSGRGMAKVKQHIEYAIEAQVSSTPTVFIDGKKIMIPPRYLKGILKTIAGNSK